MNKPLRAWHEPKRIFHGNSISSMGRPMGYLEFISLLCSFILCLEKLYKQFPKHGYSVGERQLCLLPLTVFSRLWWEIESHLEGDSLWSRNNLSHLRHYLIPPVAHVSDSAVQQSHEKPPVHPGGLCTGTWEGREWWLHLVFSVSQASLPVNPHLVASSVHITAH